MDHIVVLGGGYAGLLAASRSASKQTRVTLVDARPHFTHRIRLHEALVGRPIRRLDYAPQLAPQGISFVQSRVVAWEPQRSTLTLRAADGQEHALPYDVLINALGSHVAASVLGVHEHAIRLNNVGELAVASERLRTLAVRGGRLLVIGGGLTAIEAASEVAMAFPPLTITLATQGEFAAVYSEAGRRHLRGWMAQHGIEIREGTTVTALDADRAWLADGDSIPFDACIWAGGFVASSLAQEAGLPITANGQMVVAPSLQHPAFDNVFGAGDAVAVPRGDAQYRMACASAVPMGIHAARNVRRLLRHEPLEPFALDYVAHNISLGRRDGLIQWVHGDDSMRDRVTTGRAAALIKEAVCRMVIGVEVTALRMGAIVYDWPKRNATALADPIGAPAPRNG